MTLLDLFVLLLMSENNLEVEYQDEHVSYLGADAWVSCDKFPFTDSRSFEKGKWYPMPLGSYWHDGPKTYLEGYGVFKLDDFADNGDIVPIVAQPLPLRMAVLICEDHNEEMFQEFRR